VSTVSLEQNPDRDAFESSPLAQVLVGRRQPREALEGCVEALRALVTKLDTIPKATSAAVSSDDGVKRLESCLVSMINLGGEQRHGEFLFGELIRPDELRNLQSICTRAANILVPKVTHLAQNAETLKLSKALRDWEQSVINPALDSLTYFRSTLGPTDLLVTEPPISDMLSQRREQRIGELEQAAQRGVASIKRAAGVAGKERIAQTFADGAKEEEKTAKFWTGCVVGFVIAGIILPVVALSTDKFVFTQITGLTGTIIKALTCLPLFALATYFGHIAAQSRDLSRHLKVLTAQIDSVQAYVMELPEEMQHEIVEVLGKRAFGDPGLITRDKGKISVIPEDIIPSLQKALEIAAESLKKSKD
jgi:hypothetical protein